MNPDATIIKDFPRGAVLVWHHNDLRLPGQLMRDLDRRDIELVGPRDLDHIARLAGIHWPSIRLHPDTKLDKRQLETLIHLRANWTKP